MIRMKNQQDIQRQLQSLNILQQQFEFLKNQIEIIDNSLQLVKTTKKTIEGLTELKSGDELVVPIGGMAYIKANILESNKILMYIGSDVIIEKNYEESTEYIDELIKRHSQQRELLVNQYIQLDSHIKSLAPRVQQQLSQFRDGLQK